MTEFIKEYLDVVGMIDTLEKISRNNWEQYGKVYGRNNAWDVQDYKTIGIMCGRQSGLTQGSLKWMAKHPNKCIHITKDLKMSGIINDYYKNINRCSETPYLSLVPNTDTSVMSQWNEVLTKEQAGSIKYIIVDDSQFVFNANTLKRSDFNRWVADTFHSDTFVILIK